MDGDEAPAVRRLTAASCGMAGTVLGDNGVSVW